MAFLSLKETMDSLKPSNPDPSGEPITHKVDTTDHLNGVNFVGLVGLMGDVGT